MPLIESHPHSLEDQYAGGDDVSLLTDSVAKTSLGNNAPVVNQEKSSEVNSQMLYRL